MLSIRNIMSSQIPQFNKVLGEYFFELKLDEKGGQWRICRFSKKKFYIRPDDIDFYKKINVPPPTLSPQERIRRRIAYFPYGNLFKVKSAMTGKMIISHYPSNTPH